MKKRYTEQQIAYSLRQVEGGETVVSACRKLGISEQSFYRWQKRYRDMGLSEIKKLKQLEEENRRLKPMVADLSLDKVILRDVLSKKL